MNNSGYIQLRTTQQRPVTADEPETIAISVEDVLSRQRYLVVLGAPGSGKTTLLRYLSLIYARDLLEDSHLVQDKLGPAEPRRLPVLLPLRPVGRLLRDSTAKDAKGDAALLDFLINLLQDEGIEKPRQVIEPWLTAGKAFILLDGLDEIADLDLRGRVSRLVEQFTKKYDQCRFVVTSRIVGYTGAARLDEKTPYVSITMCVFTRDDVESFLRNWHRLIATDQMGEGIRANTYAEKQSQRLLQVIDTNSRIRDLAINPLLLTVIAIVHWDQKKLPDRRAELYAEAVDVLLGKWDEARGIQEILIRLPEGQPFDSRFAQFH